MSKTVLVIEVRCCGIVYLLNCGKRELFPLSNPAAVISFRSVNISILHGIHGKQAPFIIIISFLSIGLLLVLVNS